jgi:CheY-like chemotaxis protein
MPHVITLVDDLMFHSRIREAARGQGVEVRAAHGPKDAVEAVRDGGRLVLVDADSSRLPWAEAVSALRADPSTSAVSVVAFLSHVNVERVDAARAAGASRVLARGAFVQELPRLLAAAAAPVTTPEENHR